MTEHKQNIVSKIQAIFLILILCFMGYGFFYTYPLANTVVSELTPTATPPRANKKSAKNVRYAEFPHNVHTERLKIACNSCHKFPTANWKQVRKSGEAIPDVTDYPKHETCLNCHRQQFFKGTPPTICSICHTNPSPRDSSRHTFPNPREIFDKTPRGQKTVSDFAISFPHDQHIDIISENENPINEKSNVNELSEGFVNVRMERRREGESCVVCHQTLQPQDKSDDEYFSKPPAKLGDSFWLKKGTFKTAPISHTQCFTCHSADTGILPAPTNCAACHKLKQADTKPDFDLKLAATMSVTDKIMLSAWRKRDSSGTFRHEWFSHNDLSCSVCHNVKEMNTTVAQTKKVKVLSCGGGGTGCHITPTSDDGGILNFEIDSRKTNVKFQCVKCHISFGKSAVPESHIKAISALAPK